MPEFWVTLCRCVDQTVEICVEAEDEKAAGQRAVAAYLDGKIPALNWESEPATAFVEDVTQVKLENEGADDVG